MENNPTNETAPESTFQIFDSASELQQSLSQPTQEPVQESVQPDVQEPVQESAQEAVQEQPQEPLQETQQFDGSTSQTYGEDQSVQDNTQEYSQEQIEQAVVGYLSERLNLDLNSINDLSQYTQQSQLDERIEKIAKFVQDTGREPEDWFRYQALNPSEMDDVTSVRIQMATKYPNLSNEEVNTFLKSKYKLDPDVYSEEEVRLANLQLKIDAAEARESIDSIRNEYMAPVRQQQQDTQSFVNEDWIANMANEVSAIDGFEFDLGNGNAFTFGLDNQYKGQLVDKARNFDRFFDNYVRQDGSWDYETLSAHQTVIDNIDSIVKSAYQKGLGDGQKRIVEKTANASAESPQQTQESQNDPVLEQIKRFKFGDDSVKFLI